MTNRRIPDSVFSQVRTLNLDDRAVYRIWRRSFRVRAGIARALTFASETFVSAYCAQGLQFISDRVAAASEIRRILKPSGRLVAAVFRGLDHNPSYQAIAEAVKKETGMSVGASPFSLGDVGEIQEYMESGGFMNIDIKSHSIEVSFPDPEKYFGTSTARVMSSIQREKRNLSEEQVDQLFDSIRSRLRKELEPYVDGNRIRFPTSVHRIVASN